MHNKTAQQQQQKHTQAPKANPSQSQTKNLISVQLDDRSITIMNPTQVKNSICNSLNSPNDEDQNQNLIQEQRWIQLVKYVNSKTEKLKDYFAEERRQNIEEINFAWLKLTHQLTYHLSRVQLPSLKKLDLVQNNLGPLGAQYLSKCNWPNFQVLDIRNNNLKNEGLKHLASSDWPNLQYLLINCNQFSSIGLKSLRIVNWSNMKQLSLSKNKIGIRGMSSLAKMDLIFLNTLDLGCCGIGLEAVKKLVRANWPELILINLTMNNLGDEGIRQLSKSNWPKIQYIQLQFNNIRTGLRLLRGRWPQMRFPYLYGNKASVQIIEETVKNLINLPA